MGNKIQTWQVQGHYPHNPDWVELWSGQTLTEAVKTLGQMEQMSVAYGTPNIVYRVHPGRVIDPTAWSPW